MFEKIKQVFNVGSSSSLINNEAQQFKNNYAGPYYDPILQFSFGGEKDPGSLSPTKSYTPDYLRLRTKSWQLYYESDIVQCVVNNDINWVIGKGLAIKSEPKVGLLKTLGIDIVAEDFSRRLEDLFSIIQRSNNSTYNRNQNLDLLIKKARLTKLIGGDVLYVFRFDGNDVTLQVVDGCNVVTPLDENKLKEIKARGNRIVHGVELDDKNEHIAYWVKVLKNKSKNEILPGAGDKEGFFYDYDYIRVQRRGDSSGTILAVMGYGGQYRIDEVRGMPVLSAVMESIKNMDEYKSSVITSAEERAKTSHYFTHSDISTGENPYDVQIAQAANYGLPAAPESQKDLNGGYAVDQQFATRTAMTTNRQIVNMPRGADVKVIESKNELYLKDFIHTYFGFFCAYMQQPPEVALMSFDGSFSSSRMAGKVWEYNVSVRRSEEAMDSYIPFKNLIVEAYTMKNILPYQADYLKAKSSGWLAIEAFTNSRFVGMPVPHVDPVKEVQAERLKLGAAYDKMPLTSPADSSERLALGDFESNMDEYNDNFQKATEAFKRGNVNG